MIADAAKVSGDQLRRGGPQNGGPQRRHSHRLEPVTVHKIGLISGGLGPH
jgi:hypothetical protein